MGMFCHPRQIPNQSFGLSEALLVSSALDQLADGARRAGHPPGSRLPPPSWEGRVHLHPYTLRVRLSVERRPQWGGQVLLYLCPGCHRLRRHLYPWPVIDGRLDRDLKPRCRQCAGLRYPCQGIGGGPGVEPWDPRAVSDPLMVAAEFPGQLDVRPE